VHSTEKQGNRLVFVAEVKDELGTFREIGRGKSKSEAEKQAASKVIKKLGIEKKEKSY
jgi:dsRNA-specific ribonuclease